MAKDYSERIQIKSDVQEEVKKEEQSRMGKALWDWWHSNDGETSAHAIKRITGIDTPKPILEKDQWNPGKHTS